ncbi:hypothetical protein FE782_21890 [Paenibacillus antri]|uniref:Uncharacterized protein n=1 Tax=Paenibacillus antri TaxID=2582848 RepID=A0A5R9GB97_9BACL|nr:hypothetical protein [Paenibacillus antri]TLS49993.1 hypothetical protein FE782_21890 [Paenibacillus antri]
MTKENKPLTLLKGAGSVAFAIVASSHHWLHTLLVALGLTTLGAGLFSLSPQVKMIFLAVSLVVSLWFLRVTKRKWRRNRPAAIVYLISSLISIVLVLTALPQTISDFTQVPDQKVIDEADHENHHTPQ